MSGAPRPLDGILQLRAYQPGAGALGDERIVKLAQNEAALGPSPSAIAVVRASGNLERYPDPSLTALRSAIADHYGLDAARIICGTGSEGLLHLIGRCYLRSGDEVIFSRRAFAMYALVTHAANAIPVRIEEGPAYEMEVDRFLKALTPRTRAVFLANPNNPTGAVLPPTELRRLHAGIPSDVLLVIDAAYQDYMTPLEYRPGFELIEPEAGNVVVLGTFSKAFGLAGLRLGWACASTGTIEVLGRVRATFSIPELVASAARAALADIVHLNRELAHVRRWRPWLEHELRSMGCQVPASAGNFVLATLPEGSFGGAEAFGYLTQRRVLVRPLSSYELPRSIRISVGPEDDLRTCVKVLREFLTEHRSRN